MTNTSHPQTHEEGSLQSRPLGLRQRNTKTVHVFVSHDGLNKWSSKVNIAVECGANLQLSPWLRVDWVCPVDPQFLYRLLVGVVLPLCSRGLRLLEGVVLQLCGRGLLCIGLHCGRLGLLIEGQTNNQLDPHHAYLCDVVYRCIDDCLSWFKLQRFMLYNVDQAWPLSLQQKWSRLVKQTLVIMSLQQKWSCPISRHWSCPISKHWSCLFSAGVLLPHQQTLVLSHQPTLVLSHQETWALSHQQTLIPSQQQTLILSHQETGALSHQQK